MKHMYALPILMGLALAAPAQQSPPSNAVRDANTFVFSDGSTISRADITRHMLETNQVVPRDAGGNSVDSRSIVVQEDGTVRTSDGRPVRLLLAAPDIQPPAPSDARREVGIDGSGARGAAQANKGRTSSSGGNGIPIILGGQGKNGAAPVGRIPVLD